MNPGCRASGLFLVLLPGALWVHLRYFRVIGCSRCGGDEGL
ncbi:MAG TPA: hypothetical protein VKO83_07685 [Steroidobacteraceae bacterium]|nr:hypothetical protein [Steroidobacteraceae bacterium]